MTVLNEAELSAAGGALARTVTRFAPILIPSGDSITANGMNSSPGTPAVTKDTGFWVWANMLAGSPFDIPYCAGRSGATSTTLLANFQADVLDRNPYATTILWGANDASGTIATATIPNLRAAYDLCRAAGVYVFACAILPRTNTTDTQRAEINLANRFMEAYWRANSGGEFVDTFSAIIDPTSLTQAPLANMLLDAVHPSQRGAQKIGAVLAPRFAAIGKPAALPSSAFDDAYVFANNLNVCRNPLFLGTGGTKGTGVTGSVADYWQVNREGGTATAVCSLEARADGRGYDQVVDITFAAAGDRIVIQSTNAAAKMATSDPVYMQASMGIDASAVLGRFSLGNNGLPVAALATDTTPPVYVLDVGAGVAKTPTAAWAGGANAILKVYAEATAAGTAKVRIGCALLIHNPPS